MIVVNESDLQKMAECFRLEMMRTAEIMVDGDLRLGMCRLKNFQAENPTISKYLDAILRECLDTVKKTRCSNGKPCVQQDLFPTSRRDNKRVCPKCAQLHMRGNDSGKFLPTGRRVNLALAKSNIRPRRSVLSVHLSP